MDSFLECPHDLLAMIMEYLHFVDLQHLINCNNKQLNSSLKTCLTSFSLPHPHSVPSWIYQCPKLQKVHLLIQSDSYQLHIDRLSKNLTDLKIIFDGKDLENLLFASASPSPLTDRNIGHYFANLKRLEFNYRGTESPGMVLGTFDYSKLTEFVWKSSSSKPISGGLEIINILPPSLIKLKLKMYIVKRIDSTTEKAINVKFPPLLTHLNITGNWTPLISFFPPLLTHLNINVIDSRRFSQNMFQNLPRGLSTLEIFDSNFWGKFHAEDTIHLPRGLTSLTSPHMSWTKESLLVLPPNLLTFISLNSIHAELIRFLPKTITRLGKHPIITSDRHAADLPRELVHGTMIFYIGAQGTAFLPRKMTNLTLNGFSSEMGEHLPPTLKTLYILHFTSSFTELLTLPSSITNLSIEVPKIRTSESLKFSELISNLPESIQSFTYNHKGNSSLFSSLKDLKNLQAKLKLQSLNLQQIGGLQHAKELFSEMSRIFPSLNQLSIRFDAIVDPSFSIPSNLFKLLPTSLVQLAIPIAGEISPQHLLDLPRGLTSLVLRSNTETGLVPSNFQYLPYSLTHLRLPTSSNFAKARDSTVLQYLPYFFTWSDAGVVSEIFSSVLIF